MTNSYSSSERDDSGDGLLEDEKRGEIFIPRRTPKRTLLNHWWSWFLQALAFTCSLTLFILSQYQEPSDAACTRKLHTWCSLNLQSIPTSSQCEGLLISKLTPYSASLRRGTVS